MAGKKETKRNWHIQNKPIVWDHFKGICQECLSPIKGKWDIHHFKYQYAHGKVYETSSLELIEAKIITLVCRPCHENIHTATDSSNPQRLENKAPCENCGRIERGIFDRKKGQKLDKLLCRSCYLQHVNGVTQLSLF